jgi:hypothetical protein
VPPNNRTRTCDVNTPT